MRSRRGFTLIEMLVTIAIIAILVGVAIPAINTRYERAAEVTDLANLRSAYSTVMSAALTGEAVEVSGTYDPQAREIQWIRADDEGYTVYIRSKQKQPGWEQVEDAFVGSLPVPSSVSGWTVTATSEDTQPIIEAAGR